MNVLTNSNATSFMTRCLSNCDWVRWFSVWKENWRFPSSVSLLSSQGKGSTPGWAEQQGLMYCYNFHKVTKLCNETCRSHTYSQSTYFELRWLTLKKKKVTLEVCKTNNWSKCQISQTGYPWLSLVFINPISSKAESKDEKKRWRLTYPIL